MPRPVPDNPFTDLSDEAVLQHAASLDGVAGALDRIANAIEKHTEQRKDTDAFYGAAHDALVCFRRRIEKSGPWFLASIPAVLVAINAISPQAGKAFAAILSAFGVGAAQ